MNVLQSPDVFENFVESSTREYNINPSCSYSLPFYTWKAGVKFTNFKLNSINDKELLLHFEINIQYPWRSFKCYE